MMYGYGNGMGAWGFLLMAGSLLAILALVAVGVLVLIRRADGVPRLTTGPAGRPEAERILEQRFARGEVDQDEFRSRMDILRSNVNP